MLRKLVGKAVPFVVSGVLVVVLVRRTTAADLKAVVQSTSVSWLGICLVLVAAAFCLRACRWRHLVRSKGVALSLWDALKVQATGVALNLVAPGGSGNVLRAYYAAKWVGHRECMLSTNVANSVLSIAFATALGAAAAVYLGERLVAAMYAGLAVVLFGLLSVRWPLVWDGISWAASKLGRTGLSPESLSRFAQVGPKALAGCGAFSALILACEACVLHFAFVAMGFHPQPVLVLAYFPACMLANMLPWTISGLGSFESVVVLLCKQWGGDAAAGLVASLLFRLLSMVPALPGIWLVTRVRVH